MHHLSGIDASFLHFETPEMPMHVGSMHLFELPKGYTGDFFEDVKTHIASRMHLAPVFERKLAQIPFEMSNPVWVDDDDIDLEYHIRRIVLSKPGTFEQFEQYVGRLHSSLLDRSRPLWEFYVIEGLASGQMGLYTKVHHAAVDGQAGVALAKALYDITPEPRQVKPPRARTRTGQYQLGVAELATAAFNNTVQQYIKLVTTLPNAIRAVASVSMPRFGEGLMPRFGALPSSWSLAPKTHLNVAVTNQRAYAARSVPLAEVKQLAKAAGVSLNDIVMAACAGALRRYLQDYGDAPSTSLIAGVPVSLREAGNTDMNNQVSMMLVSLATDIADPLERLAAINASSSSSKELSGSLKAAIPTDFPSFGAPWLMTGLATLFGRSRISDQIPPVANVAISNVPGAQFALYLAGARMLTYFPVSIPGHGLALNITVQSYNGSLDYGLTACRRAVPDVVDIADFIIEAHKELARLIMANVAAGGSKAAATEPAAKAAGLGSPEHAPKSVAVEPPAVAALPGPTAVPAKVPRDAPAAAGTGNDQHRTIASNGAAAPTTAKANGKSAPRETAVPKARAVKPKQARAAPVAKAAPVRTAAAAKTEPKKRSERPAGGKAKKPGARLRTGGSTGTGGRKTR